MSRADAGQERREALFPKRVLSAPVPRFPLQIPQPLFLLAKEAQKKKLNKKKSADGEISRSAERDKATRLDGAAFSKRRAKSFEAIPP